ncbi:Indoleamine 2,3-dioxygenase [Elasticomyces elasticus]|nr:Indoleamine 2,3-dioxygenase [Elasticomyces elasticus]
MLPSIPRLQDYDVSPQNGFLPSDYPLDVLPDPYYRPWENVIKNLQALILSKRLRGVVERLPILSTHLLLSEAEWRRAYLVLAFMSHAYIWGGNTPADRVPPSISVPFRSTCAHLELPTVATYAGVVLWNYKPIFDLEPIDSLANLATLTTFTGSLDESWFYLVSVAIEARGAPLIPLMLHAIQAARNNDSHTVTECLRGFAERLDELGALLIRMHESCNPTVFYERIRPFLAGSKNMADAGLPNGVMFDDGTGEENQHYVQYAGGSNAQSSIIQFFDIVLGIEHRPTGSSGNTAPTSDPTSPQPQAPPAPSHNFILDMRRYMPGPHARFLAHVERVANIRTFVERRRSDRALSTAYDACLAMLRAFRDKHIQIVSRYIILKSRDSRSHPRPATAAGGAVRNLAHTAAGGPDKEKKNLRGTGGTALLPFLKQARDETGEPAIDAWARRLLSNGTAASEAQRGVRLGKLGEHASGEVEIVGLAGVWSVDDSDGGICHW